MTDFQLSYGSCYHFYQSGNPKEAIFCLEEDYYSFLEMFRKYVHPIVFLYAYCLLPTHFHLLLRVKEKPTIDYVYSNQEMLGAQFSNLFLAYTKHINQRYQRSGNLFNGGSPREVPRKKQLLCDLVVYIHLNPQIYGIVSDFRHWPFSSCYAYLRQDRRSMIAKELLLDSVSYQRILELQLAPRLQVMDWDGGLDYLKNLGS
jgi:hypothetical protein